MTRQEAIQTLQVYTKSPNLIRHHLATEAAMRAISKYYSAKYKTPVDEEMWALTGLLHDADYEITRSTPEKHTLYLEDRIGKILPPEVMYAIKAHNFKYTGVEPKSPMDWALYTCDELTGFVIAAVLVRKDKKLMSVSSDFILNKMGDRNFAKSVDRAQIAACEQKLGFKLLEYTQIVLASMQAISDDLGFEG